MPFEILYRWEPLRATEGITRVVAEASLYPTSGPLWEGNLLAFSVRQQVLVVVDLVTGKVAFEKEYPDKCIANAVRNGHVFFYVGGASRVFVVSLSNAQERSFPGRLVLVTEGGFLVTDDRGTIRVFDPETGECLFSQVGQTSPHPVFAIGNRIFVPTEERSHNFAGYLAFSAQDKRSFPLPFSWSGLLYLLPSWGGDFPSVYLSRCASACSPLGETGRRGISRAPRYQSADPLENSPRLTGDCGSGVGSEPTSSCSRPFPRENASRYS